MDFQSRTNSRPKFQPLRVKELLHFCESDDDESEDRTQESDCDSDSDDPQPLPPDDFIEDDSSDSLFLHTATHDNDLKGIHNVSGTIISLNSGKSASVDNVPEYKPESKSSVFYEDKDNMKNEKNTQCEESNQVKLSIETQVHKKISEVDESKNKLVSDIDVKMQSNQDELYNNDFQCLDNKRSCKLNNNSESVTSAFQHAENVSQFEVQSLHNSNIEKEPLELKATVNEEVSQFEMHNLQNTNVKRGSLELKLNDNEEKAHENVLQCGMQTLHNTNIKKEALELMPATNEEKAHCDNVSQFGRHTLQNTNVRKESLEFRLIGSEEKPHYENKLQCGTQISHNTNLKKEALELMPATNEEKVHCDNIPQFGRHTLQNTNVKKEPLEFRLIGNEEKPHYENILQCGMQTLYNTNIKKEALELMPTTNEEKAHCDNIPQFGIHTLQNTNIKKEPLEIKSIGNVEKPHYENILQCGIQTLHNTNIKKEALELMPTTNEEKVHCDNIPQFGIHNLQNTNVKKESLEFKSTGNEEKPHYENVSSSNKSLTSDTGTYVNSIDQWVLQTPLKHPPVNSMHPDPCFSRRNITQTPQSKVSDMSKNCGLTPATILSHWSQNNTKQTPLQNKSIKFKDSMQTPKNSVYFTPSIGRNETPRYSNTEVRKPLADTGGSMQNVASNRHLLQGSRLPKVNEVTPKIHNKSLCKNLNNMNLSEQISEISGNEVPVARLESNANEQLKDNKLSIENTVLDKETVKKTSDSKNVVHCSKDSKETLKPICNHPQNQQSKGSNCNQDQQQESKNIENKISNVQFSMPSNIPKARHNRTLFVKGKEYLILGTLGQGMSGEVLRVQNISSLELCAIKCVNLNRMDKDSAQGCLEEISMLHKLQAPCVVKMFDYEIKYPMVYVVMEMGDTDLSRLLKTMSQEKQISLTMILYYWTEMLTAVKHIHENGVIHSDLKPANFLLVRGRLKLIDFGIASSMNADMTSVVKNCPIGTLNYISPEALMDIGGNSDSPTRDVKYKISFKSDVWSLGCILYSLVYGRTPFQHIRSQWAKVNAITNPKLNISFPPNLPSGDGNKIISAPPVLIDVMRKCLQHNPKARPTVAELLEVEYIPSKQEHMSTKLPEIPANILVKIKRTLNEDEWRHLTWTLENARCT